VSTTASINGRRAVPGKNSGFGVASFLIGVLTPVVLVCLFVFSISLDAFLNNYQRPDFNLILGLLIIFTPPVSHLVGLMLGIVAVRQKERRKLFSVLGIILNSLFLLSAGALVIVVILIVFKSLGGFH
jgi:hypothetical protein